MDSSATTLLLSPPLSLATHKDNGGLRFNPSSLQQQQHIPGEFIWPQGDRIHTLEELNEPLVDLEGFLHGDEAATMHAAKLVRDACQGHGFFQVANHGIDAGLIRSARRQIDAFFKLPHNQKLRARRRPGSMWGYAGAHADRSFLPFCCGCSSLANIYNSFRKSKRPNLIFGCLKNSRRLGTLSKTGILFEKLGQSHPQKRGELN